MFMTLLSSIFQNPVCNIMSFHFILFFCCCYSHTLSRLQAVFMIYIFIFHKMLCRQYFFSCCCSCSCWRSINVKLLKMRARWDRRVNCAKYYEKSIGKLTIFFRYLLVFAGYCHNKFIFGNIFKTSLKFNECTYVNLVRLFYAW